MLLAWGEDHQSQPLQPGTAIDHPLTGLQIRSPGAQRLPPQRPTSIPAEPAFHIGESNHPQYLDHRSRRSISNSEFQSFQPENRSSNELLAALLNHPDIATYKERVCNYLGLVTPSLWAELYRPEIATPVHRRLTRCLSQEWGELPPDIWRLVSHLRAQPDFGLLQHRLVHAITSCLPQHPPQTPVWNHGYETRSLEDHGAGPTVHRSADASPILFRISTPALEQGRQTNTMAMTAGNLRSKSQSPYQRTRTKGRAPKGEVYKCPYKNCKHEPFRNAGNFNNHMRNAHAESEYRNRHPSEFLMPDASPQPSNQGDGTSSAATNASDSPLATRRTSQELAPADMLATVNPEGFGNIGYDMFHPSQEEIQARIIQEPFENEDFREPGVVSAHGSDLLLEGFRYARRAQQDRQDVLQDDRVFEPPLLSPPGAGPVGFGQFQQMEEQGWCSSRKAGGQEE